MNSEVAKTQDSSPAKLLELAVQQGADVGKLERLMDLQERWDKKQAEAAFNTALNEVQANLPKIERKAWNDQTRSHYAKLEAVNAALVPVYSAHGLSISWGTDQSPIEGYIRVVGDLSHIAGHTRRYFLDIPLDNAGIKGNDNKTKVHATGSSLSYARRYLTLMMFNASTYDDKDGNGDKPLPDAPEGYEQWEADMIACADEGIEHLEKAFKDSKLEYRKYITKYKADEWGNIKKKARGEV